MRSSAGRAALALIALTMLLWALARHWDATSSRPAPPRAPSPVPTAAVPAPAAAPVTTKKAAAWKAAAVIVARIADPVEPAKVRGAKLREKGEALGGRAPDRADDAAAAASQ